MSRTTTAEVERTEPADGALTQREAIGAGLLLIAGWTLIYLVMFDQGATLDLIASGFGDRGVFHELFHDGRHIGAFPCH